MHHFGSLVTIAVVYLSGASAYECSYDEQLQIVSLWKAAAQTSACSKYATPGGTFFSWPCSATSCTATLKDLANRVPPCDIDSVNERARILNGISICTGSTVSTSAPSPVSTPSNVFTPAPWTPAEESTPAPSRTMATTTTQPPSKSSSDASKSESEATPAPSESLDTCTPTQVDTMFSLFVATATSTNCKSYGTVTPFGVKIVAPCSSSCVTVNVNNLADSLPDCFYAYEGENKKEAVKDALDNCKPKSGRRLGEMAEKYFSLEVTSKDAIKGVSSNSTQASSSAPSSAPAMSTGAPLVSTSRWSWLAAALLALAAAF